MDRSFDGLELLTLQQVAKKLRVSARTIRRLVRRGELVAHYVGHNIRVDASSVMQLLEATRVVVSLGSAWSRRSDDDTFAARLTSCDNEESKESGHRSSTGAKSRYTPGTAPKLNDVSQRWPANAAELREMVRRRRLPS